MLNQSYIKEKEIQKLKQEVLKFVETKLIIQKDNFNIKRILKDILSKIYLKKSYKIF